MDALLLPPAKMYRVSASIISVKEARKLLGKAYDKCPDEAIERLVINLDSIVEAYIKSVPKYE